MTIRHAIEGKSKTEKLFDEARDSVTRLLDKFRGASSKK